MHLITDVFSSMLDGLIGFFSRAPWQILRDVGDILIVATFIYFVLAFLRGTRAMQVALGMILMLGSYALARRLGLITTWTLLDSFISYLVLIVVVLFQNDIRRALMRVGSRSFFRGQRTAKETAVIEEVIKAATSLAQKRIGALVVFERGAQLDEFIEDGTVLDADVSKELLYTIFIPSFENPMHDGAVIVRDGRVWQAGAFLPLAGTANRDRTLGARHRAALGITEESDAVVVVVSEERGAMSLCFDGNIVRGLDAPSMRDALFGLFYRTTDRRASRSDMGSRRESTGRISVTPSAAPISGHTTLPPREPIDAGVPEAPLPSTPTRPEDRR